MDVPFRSGQRAGPWMVLALSVTALIGTGLAFADQPTQTPKAPNDRSRPLDAWENPYILVDGKIDFETYNGFRRYHASCHVCHGPDGLGSSFAPNLVEAVQGRLDYGAFQEVVINGRKVAGATGDRVMPSFGTDPNVVEYIPDLWGYLKARADGVLGRGRPEHLDKGVIKRVD